MPWIAELLSTSIQYDTVEHVISFTNGTRKYQRKYCSNNPSPEFIMTCVTQEIKRLELLDAYIGAVQKPGPITIPDIIIMSLK